MLYLQFHRILDEENAINVNTGVTLRMFANMVHYGDLSKDQIVKHLSKRRAKGFLDLIEDYHRQDHELRKDMGLSKWTAPSDDA